MAKKPDPKKKVNRPGAWEPGQSGNPKGRPRKETSVKEILTALGEQSVVLRDKEGNERMTLSRREAYLLRAYEMAIQGDLAAIKFIASYTDGMPRQVQEVIQRGPDEEVTPEEEARILRLFGIDPEEADE